MLSILPLPEVLNSHSYTPRLRARLPHPLVKSRRDVINTMPPEVLGEIFLKLLEDDDRDANDSIRPLVSSTCHANPILFGRVCSYWRNIAIQTPQLWCRVHILKPKRSQVQLTKLWLERAGTHPLNLSIWAPAVEEFDRSAANDIMSLFVERRQYWRTVMFAIELQSLQVFTKVAHSQPSLCLLESATLRISKDGDEDMGLDVALDDAWKVIHASKALRYVDWRSFYGRILPDHCPWDRLTGITSSASLSFQDLLAILSRSPNLESFCAQSLCSHPSGSSKPDLAPSSVTHLRLKSLDLTSRQDTAQLFQMLMLPALQELKIRNNFAGDTIRDVVSLGDFLKRSKPQKLVNLELVDIFIKEHELEQYLRCSGFRNLLRLKIVAKITDRIAHCLSTLGEDGRHDIFPSLEFMDISSGILQTTDGALSGLAISRFSLIGNGGKLRKIDLSVNNLGPRDRAAFSNLFGRGLEGERKIGEFSSVYKVSS